MAMTTDCDHSLLVWIDLEMSGLDLNVHTIVEIAVAITDFQLKNYVEGATCSRRISLFHVHRVFSIE